MNWWLGYFCMMCVVLFFRCLCSEKPEYSGYNHHCEHWWCATAFLVLAWPVIAPLAGAAHLGKTARKSITEKNS